MKKYIITKGTVSLTALLCVSCATPNLSIQPTLTSLSNNSATTSNTEDAQFNATSIVSSFANQPIETIVTKTLYKYDHNENGQIDYRTTDTAWNTLRGKNETRRSSVSGYYTMKNLFVASDENSDGIASKDEMINFIKKHYDTNNDGILHTRGWKFWNGKDELQYFKSEVDEIYVSTNTAQISISIPSFSGTTTAPHKNQILAAFDNSFETNSVNNLEKIMKATKLTTEDQKFLVDTAFQKITKFETNLVEILCTFADTQTFDNSVREYVFGKINEHTFDFSLNKSKLIEKFTK